MIKINDKFSPRANPPDANYPYGSIKNESVPGAKDGTPLDAQWGNDYAGFDAALLNAAGIVPSGTPDTVVASQRFDSLKTIFEGVVTITTNEAATGFHSEGDTRVISDRGFLKFTYSTSRNIIKGVPSSDATYTDEVHILNDNGGMFTFSDYDKLKHIESVNYSKYVAKLHNHAASIEMTCYGDSVTFGFASGGGQLPNPYPKVVGETMSSTTQQNWVVNNRGFSGDKTLQNYKRYNTRTSGDIATFMLGINDVLFATNNGTGFQEILDPTSEYSVTSYIEALRVHVTREVLSGKCAVILGVIPFTSQTHPSLSIWSASLFAEAYCTAASDLASEMGIPYVDTRRHITNHFGVSEFTHDGIHPKDISQVMLGKRFASFFLQRDYKRPIIASKETVVLPDPTMNPINSNVPLVLSSYTDSTSPPMGGGAMVPEGIGILLPTGTGGVVTIPFFTEEDNMVVFPSANSTPGMNYSFDMWLDSAAILSQPPTTLIVPPNPETGVRSISKNNPANRSTEFYSKGSDLFINVANKGWHSISFVVVASGEEVAIEGLVFDSIKSVVDNDVLGGFVAKVVWESGALNLAKSINIDAVSFGGGVGNMGVTVNSQYSVDNISFSANCSDNLDHVSTNVKFIFDGGFRVMWSSTVGNITSLFTPVNAVVYVHGGK